MVSSGSPSRSNLELISTYFQRNYTKGKRVTVPGERGAVGEDERGPKKLENWIDWKNTRLRKIGFYDRHNYRTEQDINKAPPRVELREEGPQRSGALTSGHFEFKAYMQDKHEQDLIGEGSPKFLSSEERMSEEEEVLETEDMLIRHVDDLLEERLVGNDEVEEGRQLRLIREIIGRVEPDIEWFQNHGGSEFHKILQFSGSELLDRTNIVWKISKQVVRTLISCSSQTITEDREIFEWMAAESFGRKGESFLTKFAETQGLFLDEELLASDDDVQGSIEREFGHDGKFSEEVFAQALKSRGEDESVYRKSRKEFLTINNLLSRGIEPPLNRKTIEIWVGGIKWLPIIASKIEGIILKDRERMIEIFNDCPEAKLDDPEYGLTESQKADLGRIRESGFGGTKGLEGRTPEGIIEHNSRKLANNIKNILIESGLLRTQKMTRGEYTSYFLGDDDSLEKKRIKKWPGILVFSRELKDLIGSSEFEHFEEGRENSIYRWLRMPRDRWMYCPPRPHRIDSAGQIPGGFLNRSLSKIASNVSDYEGFEVIDRRPEKKSESSKTVRCIPNEEVIEALNALQETQWEINLDLLEAVCCFDLSTPGRRELRSSWSGKLVEKGGLINKIRPKDKFESAFYEGGSRTENDERKLLLDWARMIIEHNGNVFWHSWVCDFRGRMLPRCSILSPHDSDLGKALIRFKEWRGLGDSGFFWLKVHVHNLMEGVDIGEGLESAKKGATFQERSDWVDENIETLREIGRSPVENQVRLYLDKRRYGRREDFQRLAALLELERVCSEFEETRDWSLVRSGLPIHLDASCNGYQHVSTLLRSEELAELVNVKKSDGRPKDLYGKVAEVAREDGIGELTDFLDKISLDKSLHAELVDAVFSRSVAKKPTMIRVYGGKDVSRGLQGRRGRGRPDFSKPIEREHTERQKEKLNEIPEVFVIAFNQFLESEGKLSENFYLQHSLHKRTGKIAKKKGEGWARLLKPKAPRRLWAPGSSLHDAIIEPGGPLSDFFKYDPEGSGEGWKHQQSLTEILGRRMNPFTMEAGIYTEAIQKVTGLAYEQIEGALSYAVENCDRLWPGVCWEVLPNRGKSPGYVVHQYYIRRQGAETSRGGIPFQRMSAYSGLLPEWYSKSKYKGNTSPKSTSRLLRRVVELCSGRKSIGNDLKDWLERTKRWDEEKVLEILESIDSDGESNECREVRALIEHKDYSVQVFNPNEKKRLNRKKFGDSICPNFVHSLDAYHMRSVVRKMSKKRSRLSFWAVHDAFGTHACDVEVLRREIIDAFTELHSDRTLKDWMKELDWVGKEDAPPLDPPIKIGNLWDMGGIELSDYLVG